MRWPGWVYRLNDPRDSWTGIDKEAHLFGAAFTYAAADARHLPAVLATVVAILAVEAVEGYRWKQLGVVRQELVEAGINRWPYLCDRVSLKDIVAGVAGMILATLVIP